MEWTPEQNDALTRISEWFKSGESPRFSLGGYAGTGKTTLARHIAETLASEVKFGAFTGKAASVLRRKGCPGATTIHKLIYQPKGSIGESAVQDLQQLIQVECAKKNPDEDLLRTWRKDLEKATSETSAVFERKEEADIQSADLVIIDESSMVDHRMGQDLESYGIPVLYLGDPGQLPPVKGKAHLGPNDYDFVLKEIHRQAQDSAIIRLAHDIRNGDSIKLGDYGGGLVRIRRKADWDMELVMGADQVITGTNDSRKRITRAMRNFKGFTQVFPLLGDKLICTQNDHERGFLNGVTCESLSEGRLIGNIIYLDVEYEGLKRSGLICNPGFFQVPYGERTYFPKGDGIQQFDYGYCITGHKSQGSQWRHVVIADDKMRLQDKVQRRKWLYTVFTRAEEELTYYV